MDKSLVRDVRRGASRFSPAKRQINKLSGGHKLLSGVDGGGSGDIVFTEKSKKEKLRRLSVVGRASSSNEDCEMGCFGSDGEDELRSKAPSPSSGSCKRFKIPRKFFDDCSKVDHASVPRKLRSAMKKRSRESISAPLPDLNKSSHTINGVKKPKLNVKQGDLDQSPRRAISGPITKDEEEVVETLYALAGMFPNNDMTDKSKLNGESLEAKPLTLPDARESHPMPAFKASKEYSNTICSATTANASNPSSNMEEVPQETVQKSLSEPTVLEKLNLPFGKQCMGLTSSVPQVNLQTMPLLCKSEPIDEKLSCKSVSSGAPFELSPETGLKQPKQQENPLPEKKPDITLELAKAAGCQQEQQHAIKESKKNGPPLWPGLSPAGLHGSGIHSPFQSSAATTPAWLDAAICVTRPGSFESGASIDMVLQIPEGKDRSLIQLNQLRPNEGSKQGVLVAANNLSGVKNGLNGIVSPTSISGSAAEKIPNEGRTGILLHKRLHPDQQQVTAESGVYTSQKQSFDFFSLSAGGVGPETDNNTKRAGNGLEPLSQFHVPYLHSLAQHPPLVPLSFSQCRYSSSPYPDQLSAAPAPAQQVQLQLPPFLGSPFCGPPHISPTVSTNQQQQQQQQRIWAAQLATQYRPGGISVPYISHWQNGRQDSSSLIPCAQAILPPSPSSLEVLGPKYTPISPQPQLIAITSSLPPARVKRQHHHLPSGYEENGGGFRSDGALPLQLLCNEHL